MTPADCVLEIEFHGASSEQGAGSILNNWNRSDKNPQREVRVRENCSTWNNSPCVRLTFVRVLCEELQCSNATKLVRFAAKEARAFTTLSPERR